MQNWIETHVAIFILYAAALLRHVNPNILSFTRALNMMDDVSHSMEFLKKTKN